jgi:outer membrane protein assembly factor BamB
MCLDLEGMYDGENDGPFTQEKDAEQQDADIVWSLDMIGTLGVFPRNLATSSPVVYGDNVYAVTGNGVDKLGETIPAPDAPSFICVNKKTGEVVWKDNSPGKNVMDGQWGSPAVGEVNGKVQVYFPGGDGWLYAFDAASGDLIWKFDLNPKDSTYGKLGKGTRNLIIATPVFIENSVLLASGRDPDSGEGVSYLYRIDATKSGDVSPELDANEDHVGEPNPNSAAIWHYGGVDTDGSINGEPESDIFKRTISTVAVHNDLVYAADLAGFLHCVDFQSGKRYWRADMLAGIWGSPMVADGKVFLGDEDGDLAIFAEGKELNEDQVVEKTFRASLLCTVTIANGVMFIAEPSRLYAIATE